jgi:HEAT repeat protein
MLRAFAATLALAFAATIALADDPTPAAAPDPAKIVEALKSKDKPVRLEAAQQAKDVQDDKVISPLVALLEDEDSTLRHAAIDALGNRTYPDAQKKAAAAIAARLGKLAKKPEAEAELIASAQALGALAQPTSLDALTSNIEMDTTTDVVRARLMAVAQIPSAEAVDALIQFLAKQGRGRNGMQRDACRAALREATGENFGNEPDAWRGWWKEAKKTFDFDAAMRRRAAEKAKQADAEKKKHDRQAKKDAAAEGKKDGDGKKDEKKDDIGEDKKDGGESK